MLLHEGLTWVHSQKKPRLHFGESFTLSWMNSERGKVSRAALASIILEVESVSSFKEGEKELELRG